MSPHQLLEAGRSLAERIPYSAVALVSRFALASVFWRSAQTKVSGFSIREETFFLFRDEYKVPLLPPDLAAYWPPSVSTYSPCCCWSGWRRASPRWACSG